MHPYVLALIGGGLIGLATVLLMALTGRVAGISGIVGGLLPPRPASDRTWRIAFILGLLLAPTVLTLTTGNNRIGVAPVGPAMLVVGGLLVGIGATIGSGCTSGHGICGVSRLSPRSIVAVVTFIATAMIAVFIVRHVV